MPITIGSNIASQMALRKLSESSEGLAKTYERLASGQRINRPSDDAASVAISSSLKTGARVLRQGMRNINDGISALNIAEGGLQQLSILVTRMQELAEQSANGVYSQQQRRALHAEAQNLSKEYNRIVSTTTFNGINLFDPDSQKLVVQSGTDGKGALELAIVPALFHAVGDGTFQTMQTYDAGANAYEGVIADFNRDGNNDIMTADYGPRTVSLLLGNGDGTLGAATVVSSPGDTGPFTGGDYNNDGLMDVIVDSSGLRTLLNNGDGTFRTVYTAFAVNLQNLATGDFDGDGKLDVAAVTGLNATLDFFWGNGDGSFSLGMSAALGASSWYINNGDVNNDGRSDVVVGLSGGGGTKVYLGKADRNCTLTTSFSSPVNWLTLGDLNNDGNLDTIAGSQINFGNGDGTFGTAVTIATEIAGVTEAKTADINGDGIEDIIEMSNTSHQASVILNKGDGSFAAPLTAAVLPATEHFQLGDLNNDGIADLVAFPKYDSGSAQLGVLISNTRQSAVLAQPCLYTKESSRAALDSLSAALNSINSALGNVGSSRARLETELGFLSVSNENYEAAAARMTDADVAQESAHLICQQILQQAGVAIAAQANQQSRIVLDLLRNI